MSRRPGDEALPRQLKANEPDRKGSAWKEIDNDNHQSHSPTAAGVCRRNHGDHHDSGRRHAATSVPGDVHPAAALAAASGLSIERATMALNAAHTSPTAAGKVFGLVKPRMAGLRHALLSPQVIQLIFAELGAVYAGPVVQTQDLTVFNVTKEAVVARQAKVLDQLPPIPGKQRVVYTPYAVPPPDWWAEALIPLDDTPASA